MRRPVALILVAALAIPIPTRRAEACGFSEEPAFVKTTGPDSIERFVGGNLGILRPEFARSYLVIAYRHLAGTPLDEAERKSALALFEERGVLPRSTPETDSGPDWLAVRERVTKEKAPLSGVDKATSTYDSYLNCPDGAFATAAKTLGARLQTFAAESEPMRDWVAAQDAVFRNCTAKELVTPAPAAAGAPAILRADRAYQIAAAHFYGEKLDEARALFQAIARDGETPWGTLAPYLAARCLVRKGTLRSEPAALEEALRDLDALLARPELLELHHDVKRLRRFVELRTRPAAWLPSTSALARTPRQGATFGENVAHLTELIDRDKSTWNVATSPGRDELADWVLAFQDRSAAATEASLARWKARKELPWLVAALAGSSGKKADPALLDAAGKVPETSPAYLSLAYHRTRLLIESGEARKAWALAGDAMKPGAEALGLSAWNLFLAERLAAAPSLAELLKAAPRRATDSDDPRLDTDAVGVFQERLPLRLLAEAARSGTLAGAPGGSLRALAFGRALLLGDRKIAEELSPSPAAVAPESEWRYRALAAYVADVDVKPLVDGTDWCASSFTPRRNGPTVPIPAFLTPDDVEQAEKEAATLSELGSRVSFFCRDAIAFANEFPKDPRAPKALHLAVRSTRTGCADGETGTLSKAAFDLLHKQYPKSSWAKATKYWYSGR